VAAADNGHGDGDPTTGPDGVRIGAQLRAARLAARKSMAEVADEAGLTKGFVSKLERDLANVSVASLIRLCDALGVPVGSMFQASKGEIIRQGEYPPIDFGGTGMREYLLTPSGEKRVQVILSDIRPGGGSGEEAYALPADVEFAYILTGRLYITVDDEEVTLEQGDAYTFRADAPHTFRSAHTSGQTQVLWLVSPALPDTGWQRPVSPGELPESH
jgi:transcriptional regulator with XRE-family HTH domain/mannose-6-phosphate isomerase-like protein (cupin superfamily)